MINLPGELLPDEYYEVRYEVLRKPLGSPKGSEQLPRDNEAVNVWVEENGVIGSVGRAHLLGDEEDGSAVDVKAKSACPAFSPLGQGCEVVSDDKGVELKDRLRPAVQIRGMGTLEQFRGRGFASLVLAACETESVTLWEARTGWLQARISAIPFYQKNGWTCFGPEYHVPNVGPHRSMWKKFENLIP